MQISIKIKRELQGYILRQGEEERISKMGNAMKCFVMW
jgi:hypothetical protein